MTSALRRAPLRSDDLRFDLVLVMDDLNYSTVIARAEAAQRDKVRRDAGVFAECRDEGLL